MKNTKYLILLVLLALLSGCGPDSTSHWTYREKDQVMDSLQRIEGKLDALPNQISK